MEFTIEEIRNMFWAIRNYSQILKNCNVTTYEPLDKITEKIWENLTKEQKKQVDPDKYTREMWLSEEY